MTRSSDTQYDHTREERYAISPSLLWQPDSDTSLLLRAYLQKRSFRRLPRLFAAGRHPLRAQWP
ncbi:ferrioxamine receptor [Klebsiella pneumoniae subsp. ozaenae]|uniref:Ferrioxamine receptor n=1 Tax=Klebsiella pneumoniae subsp. ozaenae TaxID=574 RepID=A0A378BFH9_KLEPO|nr:ferrioxamine receptor [Klebsiella pneumoniae subsp. ozaenae]